MALFNCCFYHAEYIHEFKAIHIIFKGKVRSDQILKLRHILGNLSASLKVEKLILDFSESTQVFIDYNSYARISFWKTLKKQGLQMLLLVVPPKFFKDKVWASWASFYEKNNLAIQVSAISDRKLMPLFMLNKSLSPQVN